MCDNENNVQQNNNNEEDIEIKTEWMMHLEKGAKIKKDKEPKSEEKEENS